MFLFILQTFVIWIKGFISCLGATPLVIIFETVLLLVVCFGPALKQNGQDPSQMSCIQSPGWPNHPFSGEKFPPQLRLYSW